MIFDERACSLGEGPLWHPKRQELFWFDINARKLHTKAQTWDFELSVSAAGWVDETTLLIASEIGLHRFDIERGELADPLVKIETMGFHAEPKAGAIYRFYKGELRVIAPDITIPNAICFAVDHSFAHYTDTVTKHFGSRFGALSASMAMRLMARLWPRIRLGDGTQPVLPSAGLS